MTPIPEAVLASLTSIDGVEGVTAIHTNPFRTTITVGDRLEPTGLVSCAELALTPALGYCDDGADVAALPARTLALWDSSQAETGWSAADISPEELQDLLRQSVVVATDGSTPAIERARTILEATYPDIDNPETMSEFSTDEARTLNAWQQLANVVVLTSLVIAGCSLAVSVAAGLLDRKRAFSLLRLTGVPLRVLRRVVALESAVPLLTVALVSTATGFLTAHLFLRVQLDYSLRAPGPEYYIVVLTGLIASFAVIGSTLPLLERITGPDTARNE